MKKLLLLALFVVSSLCFTACAHNIGGNVTGLLITQGGLFFGSGTIAIQKENSSSKYTAGSDSTRLQYEFETGRQTNGYDVELEKVKK